MVGYKSSRMRKLVEKLRPASGAASIVSNPFPPPRRSLSPRGPPSPPPPPPSLPRQDVAVLEDGSRGLFRQLANPANMCQHVRVRVRVHVCVPRDLATLSSLLRYPPSLPPSADLHVLARRFHGRENQSVRGDTRFPREDRTLTLSRVLLGAESVRWRIWTRRGARVKFSGS